MTDFLKRLVCCQQEEQDGEEAVVAFQEPEIIINNQEQISSKTSNSYIKQLISCGDVTVKTLTKNSGSSDGSEGKIENVKDLKIPILPDPIVSISDKFIEVFSEAKYNLKQLRLLFAEPINIGEITQDKQANQKTSLADKLNKMQLELEAIIQKREEERKQVQNINQQVTYNIGEPMFQNNQNIFIKLQVPCPRQCNCLQQKNSKEWCFSQCEHQCYLNQFGYLRCQEQDSGKCVDDQILKISFQCNGQEKQYNMFDLLFEILVSEDKLFQEEKLTFIITLFRSLILEDNNICQSKNRIYPINK